MTDYNLQDTSTLAFAISTEAAGIQINLGMRIGTSYMVSDTDIVGIANAIADYLGGTVTTLSVSVPGSVDLLNP